MTVSKGVGSWLGFAEESTYGTAVSPPTKFVEVESHSIKQAISAQGAPTMRRRSVAYYSPSKKAVSGGFDVLGDYSGGLNRFLKHAMGDEDTTGPTDTCYTHVFTLTDDLPTGMTIEVKPDGGQLGKNLQFPGCKINKMSISVEQEKHMELSFDVVGSGDMNLVNAATPTFPTFKSIQWSHLVATLNSTAVKVQKLKIDVDNAVSAEYCLGQQQAQAAEPKSQRKVSGTITLILDGLTQLNLFLNQTEVNAVFTFTSTVLAGTTTYYSWAIRIPRMVFSGDSPTAKDDGIITLEMPFDAFYDVTNSLGEIQITTVDLATAV